MMELTLESLIKYVRAKKDQALWSYRYCVEKYGKDDVKTRDQLTEFATLYSIDLAVRDPKHFTEMCEILGI